MSLIRSKPQFYPFFSVSVLRCLGGCATELRVSGVLPLCSCPWKSWELCSSSSARATPPSELKQVCQSHLAGQDRSVPRGIGSCSVPLAHTPLKQELLSRYHPNLAWFHSSSQQLMWLPSFSWIPWSASQGHLPDFAHFYIPFVSHILPRGCLTAF